MYARLKNRFKCGHLTALMCISENHYIHVYTLHHLKVIVPQHDNFLFLLSSIWSHRRELRWKKIKYHVRTDLGGENTDVWHYMIQQHQDSAAVITGSSTHNERIERLWRDVFRSVSSLFYDVSGGLRTKRSWTAPFVSKPQISST